MSVNGDGGASSVYPGDLGGVAADPRSIGGSLVIFSSRESDAVLHANVSALRGALPPDMQVVILVNGNGALVGQLRRRLAVEPPPFPVSLWEIPHGDKANAWNQYVHAIWQGESLVCFIDGYVTLPPLAIARLAEAVEAGGAHVLGGTGQPSIGRGSAALRERMRQEGGFHGNFCCLKGSTIAAMRARGLRLPVGLYRTDSLMGAFLSFGLHPESSPWDPSRIAVADDATWLLPKKQWWRPGDVKGQIKRVLRQGRGRVENAAVKFFLATRHQPIDSLPATARALALAWQTRAPQEVEALLRADALNRRGWRELLDQQEPVPQTLAPRLVWRTAA
ncbi:hypothetical protein PV762_03100 [Mitsuaria sp. CC2]|uniref:hypothetical protein n=1 Tax=Mitsuaria sp. CC2 TaxID=3029186 RepID=UPI003B8B29DF